MPQIQTKTLHLAASYLHDDASMPVQVPASTVAFLDRLGEECNDTEQPLGGFLAMITPIAIAEAILCILFPDEMHSIRAQLDHNEREKQDAIASSDFERAATLVDHRRVLKRSALQSTLREMVDSPVILAPHHFGRAIAELGYDHSSEL